MPKGGWQGQEVRRKKWTPRQDHAAVPRTPVAKRFEAGGTDSSLLSISAPPRAHPWRSLRRAAFLRPPDRRDTDLEGDPRLPCTGAGAPSPLRFGAAGHGSGSDRPVRRLIGAATAPPLPCCAVTDRGFTARGRRARPRRRRAPAAGGGSRRRRGVPLAAHLRHAAEDEATKAHRLLDLRMRANDVPYACGPNSAAGRRGRRRSAYEAPRAAADRGTRFSGAESKRRGCPRLPALPLSVTRLAEVLGARAQQEQGDEAPDEEDRLEPVGDDSDHE